MKSDSTTFGETTMEELNCKVTEEDCAQQALRESEERYRVLVEFSPNIICVHRDAKLLYINPAGARFFGANDPAELIGRSVLDFIHPDSLPVVTERLRRLRAGETAPLIEERFVTLQGDVRDVEVTAIPITYECGPAVQVIVRDITEHKRVAQERERLLAREREALAEAEAAEDRFCDLVNAVEGIVWELDARTLRFTFVSRRAERVLGYPLERWMNEPKFWHEHIHPEDREWAIQYCMEETAKQRDHEFEYRMIAADGRIVWLKDLVTVVIEDGQVTTLRGVMFDITERKKAEALLAAEKLVLEMIATGVALEEILNRLCLLIEEQRSGTFASVLLLNPDAVHLNSVAGPSIPKEWTQQMETLPIGPCAGSCGTAAYRGSQVIVSDIATDPLWDVPEHRSAALKHGLRASWSNPVLSSKGKVLGTFCMYYREPRTPTSQDLELIELATHLVGVAIERDRAEEALRASEQLARGQVEALAQSLDVLATAPEPEKFIGKMLSTIGRLLNGQGASLWMFDPETDALHLRLCVEGDNPRTIGPDHPLIHDPASWRKNPLIEGLRFTGVPLVCEDIEADPALPPDWREYFKGKGLKKFLAVPVVISGDVKGFITVRHGERPPYRPEEIGLAQALAHQVMLALQLNELADQNRKAAVFEERNRMARDIHDTLAQGFTGVIVQLEAAEDAIVSGHQKEADKHLVTAAGLARQSLSEARRSVQALRPQALEDGNFWDALKRIIKNTTLGTALHTKVELRGKLRELPSLWQENLLHIGQEALTNTLKHAHASRFETRLTFNAKEVRLELRDNGCGFKINGQHDGAGLAGMQERVKQMGGTLNVTSSRGKGTKVVVVSPYNEQAA